MIIYLDLETTGLDPNTCAVLEIAAVETTDAFVPTRGFHAILRPTQADMRVSGENSHIGPVHATVQIMHTNNKLWTESAQGRPAADVWRELAAWLGNPGPHDLHTIAGSSVHFDLGFLRVHAPEVAAKFSHRVLDLSAVRLMRRLCGKDDLLSDGKPLTHRAKDDVMFDISVAQKILGAG